MEDFGKDDFEDLDGVWTCPPFFTPSALLNPKNFHFIQTSLNYELQNSLNCKNSYISIHPISLKFGQVRKMGHILQSAILHPLFGYRNTLDVSLNYKDIHNRFLQSQYS